MTDANKCHAMNLKKIYFEYIKQGIKTIELRCNDDKRKLINIGDDIIFSSDSDSIKKNVFNILYFKTFEEAIVHFGVDRIIPFETKKGAIEIYKNLYGDKVEIYGVVAFVL